MGVAYYGMDRDNPKYNLAITRDYMGVALNPLNGDDYCTGSYAQPQGRVRLIVN